MEPLVSIVIPVYQTEKYLARCMDSVLAQTYGNLEIFLVDDGSPDGCGALCDAYGERDGRIRVIHKKNGGASSARNAALDRATGEYVVFIDSDDSVAPDYIETLLRYDADVVVCGVGQEKRYTVADVKKNYFMLDGLAAPWNKLYRFSKIASLRFREDIPVGEDIVFNLNVLHYIAEAQFITYSGYYFNTENENSLTRNSAGHYNPRMDEEYQEWWGKIQQEELAKAGINRNTPAGAVKDGSSLWIFQKMCNQCYEDCPHPKKERLARIDRQIKAHRKRILKIKNPADKKTFAVVWFCCFFNSKRLAYTLLRSLIHIKAAGKK